MEAYVFGDRFQVIRSKADVIYLFIKTFNDNSIPSRFNTPDSSDIATPSRTCHRTTSFLIYWWSYVAVDTTARKRTSMNLTLFHTNFSYVS